jgi:hypothetical protein
LGEKFMPQRPRDLSRIIREMAERAAKDKRRDIDEAALKRISRIPLLYRFRATISVDLAKLEDMIRDIIWLAAQFTGPQKLGVIDDNAMKKALVEVKCHYLWFC